MDGILVPGGFGDRGIEGKIQTVEYARTKGCLLYTSFLAGRMDAYLKPMPGPPGDNSARIA